MGVLRMPEGRWACKVMIPETKLIILFVIRSPDNFHHYRHIISSALQRGYSMTVVFDPRWSKGVSHENVQTLKQEFPHFVWEWAQRCTD